MKERKKYGGVVRGERDKNESESYGGCWKKFAVREGDNEKREVANRTG